MQLAQGRALKQSQEGKQTFSRRNEKKKSPKKNPLPNKATTTTKSTKKTPQNKPKQNKKSRVVCGGQLQGDSLALGRCWRNSCPAQHLSKPRNLIPCWSRAAERGWERKGGREGPHTVEQSCEQQPQIPHGYGIRAILPAAQGSSPCQDRLEHSPGICCSKPPEQGQGEGGEGPQGLPKITGTIPAWEGSSCWSWDVMGAPAGAQGHFWAATASLGQIFLAGITGMLMNTFIPNLLKYTQK